MNLSKSHSSVRKPLLYARHRAARSLSGAVCAALLCLAGCGGNSGEDFAGSPSADSSADSSAEVAGAAAPMEGDTAKSSSASEPGAPVSATAQLIQLASAVPRRIIYNATLDLIADNFSSAQAALLKLVKTSGGYVAETNIGAAPGHPRDGSWKIRVPEANFAAFMASATKLGELQTTHTDSQDVTAQFTDLQARIANKQVEEARLIALLQNRSAKLSEILQVERELSRVRGEVEQMQGQLRLLANQSALATITVTLHEIKGYVAPKPTTFGSEISRTFSASIDGIREMGKGLFLIAVALAPWLVVLAIVGVPVWLLARYQRKKL